MPRVREPRVATQHPPATWMNAAGSYARFESRLSGADIRHGRTIRSEPPGNQISRDQPIHLSEPGNRMPVANDRSFRQDDFTRSQRSEKSSDGSARGGQLATSTRASRADAKLSLLVRGWRRRRPRFDILSRAPAFLTRREQVLVSNLHVVPLWVKRFLTRNCRDESPCRGTARANFLTPRAPER
jgi:hypothetical protein